MCVCARAFVCVVGFMCGTVGSLQINSLKVLEPLCLAEKEGRIVAYLLLP